MHILTSYFLSQTGTEFNGFFTREKSIKLRPCLTQEILRIRIKAISFAIN